tara:strand:- start:797 stop:1558 length:762 start_codon:yes stop_codon:yes gene_type:complete
MNNASWSYARRERPGEDFGDSLAGHWRQAKPFCLNSGNIAGRPAAIIDLLNKTCRACRRGWSPQQVFEHFSRTYSEGLGGWIYPAQRGLMKLYLAAPSAQTGWTLDYGNEVFHTNGVQPRPVPRPVSTSHQFVPGVADGVPSRSGAVQERFDGSLSSRVTRTTPALVHYNGPSRENWERWQSPGARLAKLQDAFVTNSGARSDAEADAAVERFVRERVAFLGPDLVRRREVGLAAACAGGGRLSKRFHEKYNP